MDDSNIAGGQERERQPLVFMAVTRDRRSRGARFRNFPRFCKTRHDEK
jgi:hypothetical protein